VPPSLGYTAAQVRAAEIPLLDAGEPLMRRAASALAAELRGPSPARILALVGAGDNGGDALFAARSRRGCCANRARAARGASCSSTSGWAVPRRAGHLGLRRKTRSVRPAVTSYRR